MPDPRPIHVQLAAAQGCDVRWVPGYCCDEGRWVCGCDDRRHADSAGYSIRLYHHDEAWCRELARRNFRLRFPSLDDVDTCLLAIGAAHCGYEVIWP